jgi:hypothetical protein
MSSRLGLVAFQLELFNRKLRTARWESRTIPSTTVPLTMQVLKLRMQLYEDSRPGPSDESLAKA